jgi:ubiquinone/menaquinone biosynthesis C-methylase UbiE
VSGEPGLSFGGVAGAYERARPQYAADAVEWIASRLPLGRVLDLAAGTGKLTRQLLDHAESVVAVEPDDAMRAVLERVVPQVESLPGTAEQIPLAEASVDVVAVGQAFHWFDMGAALAELQRVIRPGGGFALVWNEYDWPELNAIVDRLRPTQRARDDAAYARLIATTLFGNFEERRFAHHDRVNVDRVVERVASISAVINASPGDREAAFDDVRRLVGAGMIDFPMQTLVIVADRV